MWIDTPILRLNGRWRVAHDHQLQWVLEVRKSDASARSSGYTGRRYHTSRTALISSMDELCEIVDKASLAEVKSWPERYQEFPRNRKTGAEIVLPHK